MSGRTQAWLIAVAIIFSSAAAPHAFAQTSTCPQYVQGQPTPLSLGSQAVDRNDYAAAARYFEQHKACVEQSRPGARDWILGRAYERLVLAYLDSNALEQAYNRAGEVLEWYPAYVANLGTANIGPDDPPDLKNDEQNTLITLYYARAFPIAVSRPQQAELLLERAIALMTQMRSVEPPRRWQILKLHAAMARNAGDMQRAEVRQRRYVDDLKRNNANPTMLRVQMVMWMADLRDLGRIAEANTVMDEIRKLPPPNWEKR